jgi:competence protein ComEC
MFSLGMQLVRSKDPRNDPNWIGNRHEKEEVLLARIVSPPEKRGTTTRAIARAEGLCKKGRVIPATGKLWIYFKQPGDHHYMVGERILLRGPITIIKNNSNPGGFNYRRYCLFKGITHQVFADSGNIIIAGSPQHVYWSNLLVSARQIICDDLKRSLPGQKESGLAEALLIGVKNDLDPGLVQAYTNTGTVHIIAISGMHLAVIYSMLGWLLGALPSFGIWRWFHTAIILSILWVFSFIAGGQPSILRATVMFTFIVLGKALGRKNMILNSIAGSAFLLLCVDPFSLFDPGFQLSYMAVISIILFYSSIYHLLHFQNKIIDHSWKLISVTLSAQLLTIPVSLYHFHQFPVYFLLSNLVAVPLSGIVLMGEIITCIFSFAPVIARACGSMTSLLIGWMNSAVEWIGDLPGNRIGGVVISSLQAVFLLGFIILLMNWLHARSASSLLFAMGTFVLFLVIGIIGHCLPNEKNRIIIYSIPRHSGMDFMSSRSTVLVQDSIFISDPASFSRYIQPTRALFGVKNNCPVVSLAGSACFNFCGSKLLIVRSPVTVPLSVVKDTVGLLVLSNKANPDITSYLGSFVFPQVILDGSYSYARSERAARICDSLHIPCHDTKVKGAFVMQVR